MGFGVWGPPPTRKQPQIAQINADIGFPRSQILYARCWILDPEPASNTVVVQP